VKTRSVAATRRPAPDYDDDIDAKKNETGSLYDRDDGEDRFYGRAASAADTRTVKTLLVRYYAAVAADDGATACRLIDPTLATAFGEERGRAAGGSHSYIASCAPIMSKLLKHIVGRSAAELAAVKVIEVRVKGTRGLGLLRLPTSEVRYIPVGRENGAWRRSRRSSTAGCRSGGDACHEIRFNRASSDRSWLLFNTNYCYHSYYSIDDRERENPPR
jgi:hypothetical protein